MAFPTLYRSIEDYTTDQIARIQLNGAPITDFTFGGAGRTLLESVGTVLSKQSLVLDQLQRDVFVATATGDFLDRRAADFQVLRKSAVAATGTIRATRQATNGALSIPAGWGALQTKPVTGQTSVSFVTTGTLDFADTVATADAPAQCVVGGAIGNLADQTQLLAVNPINGIQTDGGFKAQGAFAGGVDVETDDQLRVRIPIEVQGRVGGTDLAFLAAALRVPGVLSGKVLRAGDARFDTSVVSPGNVEVYYEGTGGLLSQVTSEAATAARTNQQVSAFQAATVNALADVVVFALTGTDTGLLTANAKAALKATVENTGVGEKARYSIAIQGLHAIPEVVSVGIPFNDFRKASDPDNTVGDIDPGSNRVLALPDGNITVAVSLI